MDHTQRSHKNACTARDSIKRLLVEKKRSIDQTSESPQVKINQSVAKLEKTLDGETSATDQNIVPIEKHCEKKIDEEITGKKPSDITSDNQPETPSAEVKTDQVITSRVNDLKTVQEAGIVNKAFADDEKNDLLVRVIPPTIHNTLDNKTEEPPKVTEDNREMSLKKDVPNDNALSKEQKEDKIESFKDSKSDKNEEKKEKVEDEIQFDPEGRSAISGQKRTGWI